MRNTMADVTDDSSPRARRPPQRGRLTQPIGADIMQDIAEPIMEWDQEARILEPLAEAGYGISATRRKRRRRSLPVTRPQCYCRAERPETLLLSLASPRQAGT